jgi:hypothetical protein
MDPHFVAAMHMWNDIQKYELFGQDCHNTQALKTRFSPLV